MTAKKQNNTATDFDKEETQLAAVEGETAITKFDDDDLYADADFDLPRGTSIPRIEIQRESPTFKMPGDNIVKEFTGHILHMYEAGQLYYSEYGDSETGVPDCASVDKVRPTPTDGFGAWTVEVRAGKADSYLTWMQEMVKAPAEILAGDPAGDRVQVHILKWAFDNKLDPRRDLPENIFIVKRAGGCESCPANVFGTALNGGKGKACQDSHYLYILVDGDVVPSVMKVPPSSLGKKDEYKTFMSSWSNMSLRTVLRDGSEHLIKQSVKIRFTLKEKRFEKYSASILIPKYVETLQRGTPELGRIMQISQSFTKRFKGIVDNMVTETVAE